MPVVDSAALVPLKIKSQSSGGFWPTAFALPSSSKPAVICAVANCDMHSNMLKTKMPIRFFLTGIDFRLAVCAVVDTKHVVLQSKFSFFINSFFYWWLVHIKWKLRHKIILERPLKFKYSM